MVTTIFPEESPGTPRKCPERVNISLYTRYRIQKYIPEKLFQECVPMNYIACIGKYIECDNPTLSQSRSKFQLPKLVYIIMIINKRNKLFDEDRDYAMHNQ